MKTGKFNIFLYTDYHSLLKDYYSFQKKSSKSFSFRSFAAKAGVSQSMFKDIISGRRRLSLAVMKKYAAAMNLTQRETEYFGAIVQFVNCKTNYEKNLHFTRMQRLRRDCDIKILDESRYEFFRNWYHSAIRELVTLPDFREDYDWIAKKCIPGITASQARKSIETMLRLGILRRDPDRKLQPADPMISSEYEMRSLILRNFHSEMLSLAKDALERFEPRQREISSLTFGLSHKCYERIKERIRSFKEELMAMVLEDTDISEMVCQCNFQLFPLTEKTEEKEETQ
ncbi:MAG: TIGR02147 family protein [Fibrobacter sp.]|nr:TIGR02147 family protein [Fibrobacter sp.]